MLNDKELWDELKKDICNIILNTSSNLIFVIGDNSSGKSQIGNMLKDKILVLDNYKGTYEHIPKDKKVLVITYNLYLLLEADKNTNVIITNYNNLYISTTNDFNNYNEIITFVESEDILSAMLNNAMSNCWSELNEMYLNEYIANNQIKETDKLVIDMINKCKN